MTQEIKDYSLSEEQREQVAEKVENVIEKTEGARPVFYAITGSHLYGYPSKNSDVDVKGFHVCPPEQWVSLDGHIETIKTTSPGIKNDGEIKDIELKSYELRKFGSLISTSNPNIIETLFSDQVLFCANSTKLNNIKVELDKELPMNIPYRYASMARGNYKKYLADPDKGAYRPQAKKYLHVLRGLLGAKYVQDNRLVTPKLKVMSEAVLGGDDMVSDLIAAKKINEGDLLDSQMEAEAQNLVEDLIDETNYVKTADLQENIAPTIDEWMLDFRKSLQ